MSSQDVTIYNEDNSYNVDVTTTNRLKVDSLISGIELTQSRPGKFRSAYAVDSGASPDMNVDGSSTPVPFNIVPNTGKVFVIQRLIITMIDASINFSKFGGISSLTNGVKFEVKEGGDSVGEVTISPIKVNSQFYEAGLTTEIQSADKDIFQAIFNLGLDTGTSIQLTDSLTEYVRLTIQDNLTSLDSFRVTVQGYEVDE